MALEINEKTIKDRLFFHERDGVHRLVSHSTEHTALIRSVSNGDRISGVVGCPNFAEFDSISDMEKDDLIKVIDFMAFRTEMDKDKIDDLQKEVDNLKRKYQTLYIQYLERLAGIEGEQN